MAKMAKMSLPSPQIVKTEVSNLRPNDFVLVMVARDSTGPIATVHKMHQCHPRMNFPMIFLTTRMCVL